MEVRLLLKGLFERVQGSMGFVWLEWHCEKVLMVIVSGEFQRPEFIFG